MQAVDVHALNNLPRRVGFWSRRVKDANLTISAGHYEQLMGVMGILATHLADPRVCILTETVVDELRQALAELAKD